MRPATRILLPALALSIGGCAARSHAPRTAPATRRLEVREGLASYYARDFDRKMTASGVRFDNRAMMAAHPAYPFGTLIRVTNLTNGRSVQVRVQDRGPAPGPRAAGVIIDLSFAAARALDFVQEGRTRVRLEVLRWGS
ncbi:MAG TPA: septal ring lytic transglycosylase RlpA family protein [Vicinamibacterales bacterium]|nr:septal ring lytic transglycosylase RlpA family protein [Vicinamibacterales bacterium]